MLYHEVGEIIGALWTRYPTAHVDDTTIARLEFGLKHVELEAAWSAVSWWTANKGEWPTLPDLLDVVYQQRDGMLGVRHSAWQEYEAHCLANGRDADPDYFRAEWALA